MSRIANEINPEVYSKFHPMEIPRIDIKTNELIAIKTVSMKR
jgi:hypothetical protein